MMNSAWELTRPAGPVTGAAPGAAREAAARAVRAGTVSGLIAVYAAAVGVLTVMNGRVIIIDVLTLSECLLGLLGLWAGTRSRFPMRESSALVQSVCGLVAGAIYGAICAGLLAVLQFPQLRTIFVALSPELRQLLALDLDPDAAMVALVAIGALLGMVGALWHRLGQGARSFVIAMALTVLLAGALQELIQVILQRFPTIDVARTWFFEWNGLSLRGAIALGLLAGAIRAAWLMLGTVAMRHDGARQVSERYRRAIQFAVLVAALALLPALAGSYVGQVLVMVGLYILMGMGLNIEVGLAGLLDLGFVAFFAVGAYGTALMTADSPLALSAYTAFPALSFWQAAPIAVGLAVLVGVVFGLPVLGVRGDYLAIATLGLGEIVRVIVLSDMAAPFLGGAQGILHIPKPSIGPVEIGDPVSLFYVTLVLSAIAAFIAWRLQHSRLGRAWRALRDDEDVAQALGVNLVKAKLLAYGLGAAFAGLAGAIFATMLTSVYPNSFTLLVSINVLALIVIGGMGTIQGVVVGALILVGLPELLREFGEYRLLLYGFALVAIMIVRPTGLWPARRDSGSTGNPGAAR